MSNNWLVKMAQQQPTSEQNLQAAIEALPPEDLHELALDTGVTEPTDQVDFYAEKVAQADAMGRELARLHGSELADKAEASLEKTAIWGAIAGLAARALGGAAAKGAVGAVAGGGMRAALGGVAKNVIKDQALGMASNAVSSGINKIRQPVQQAAESAGGFKYASELEQVRDEAYEEFLHHDKSIKKGKTKKAEIDALYDEAFEEFAKEAGWGSALVQGLGSGAKGNSFLRGAAGMAMRDPKKALALGGAAIGAAQGLIRDPGYDENGNHKSRLGAAAKGAIGGGAIGYGVGHFSAGARGAVQGLGKDLSKDLRAHSWANQAALGPNKGKLTPSLGGAMGAKPAKPLGSGATAAAEPSQIAAPAHVPSQAAGPIAAASPSAPPLGTRGAEENAAMEAMKAGIKVPSESLPANHMVSNGGINVPAEQAGGRMVGRGGKLKNAGQIKLAHLSSVDRIRLVMSTKLAAPLFSMTNPATAAKGMMSGLAGAAKKAVPPPIPAAARAGGGLAAAQKSLNSAQSVAGGGLPRAQGATIHAMPGSGW